MTILQIVVEDKPTRTLGPKGDRAWTDAELEVVQKLRALPNPPTYAEIGKMLGGRTEQSVRLKLYDIRARAERGGANRPLGFPQQEREARIQAPGVAFPDLMLCDAVMAGGGMSRLTEVWIKGKRAFCLPLIGPDGKPRPPGWRDGAPIDPANHKHMAHMISIQRWWKAERARIKAPPIKMNRDA